MATTVITKNHHWLSSFRVSGGGFAKKDIVFGRLDWQV